jgi:5-formyltetrahydrofolate cyclo-ligase
MTKDELRRALKKERGAVPKAERESNDRALWAFLSSWETYCSAQTCMTYLSFGWEINTWPLVEQMWRDGKQVCVPVTKPGRKLVPVSYTPETEMVKAPFGMLEPKDSPELDPAELDLIIVPGLAFSAEGYRIGFGGGYYDRFLGSKTGTSVGVCYSQFIRALPVDPWDVPVDYILTEKGFLQETPTF